MVVGRADGRSLVVAQTPVGAIGRELLSRDRKGKVEGGSW